MTSYREWRYSFTILDPGAMPHIMHRMLRNVVWYITAHIKKGNAIHVTCRESSKVVRRQGFPSFLGKRLTDGGEVVGFTPRPHFTPPGRFVILIPVRGGVEPVVIVRLKLLGDWKIQWFHRESNPWPSGLPQPTTCSTRHVLLRNYIFYPCSSQCVCRRKWGFINLCFNVAI
jgi:hypothetical protein